ncbi:MAG: glycosyltransferase family 1 protein [Cyanobacteria bacterium J083]|nr:MAG: glycosyltransferase family 1 protein [Cyanobacteria bacterium J083]
MRVAILRREPKFSFSMDVYADGIVQGLQKVRPDWEIIQLQPKLNRNSGSLLGGLQKYYQRYWHYPQILRQYQVDLCHIIDHSDGHLAYWLKKYDTPHVITCHDLINLVRPETFRGKARFASVSMATWQWAISGLKIADRIIAVSSHTAKDITDNLNVRPSQITVIPNAVDLSFQPLAEAKIGTWLGQHNISPTNFYLLNVGSNHPRKNVSTVLQVLHLLRQRGLPVCLWKVGTDFNSEQKALMRTHNLADWVTYWGEPNAQTLIQLYNAADLLLAPSLYEGFGMTILEAMACGTPVVTSNTSSLPEVAGDAAILVKPLDLNAIADAVQAIYSNHQLRQSLIQKGLARVKHFTWEQTALQVAELYEKTLQAR